MPSKWFEKTVEYNFVARLALAQNKSFISPLDGNLEIVGDAIFIKDNRWMLIEFKRDANTLSDEIRKFHNYGLAKNSLAAEDSHHYLIYGIDNNEEFNGDTLKLGLSCRTYFSEIEIKQLDESGLNELLSNGEEYSVFLSYLQRYIKFKKGGDGWRAGIIDKPNGPNDDSGPTLLDYGVVVGISNDNEMVCCLSLREFMSVALPQHQEKHEFEEGWMA